VAHQPNLVMVQLPSGKLRFFQKICWATVGQVGNLEFSSFVASKAGCNRWLGKKSHVRGVAMNPCDHPHGGGEGRSPVGRLRPVSPWGKPALGKKTRRTNKYSNIYLAN
jgi:large subunit ribosomal protein L2